MNSSTNTILLKKIQQGKESKLDNVAGKLVILLNTK